MDIKDRIYMDFANIFPRAYRHHMRKLLIYAGERKDADYYLGSTLILSILFSLIIAMYPWAFKKSWDIRFNLSAVGVFVLIELAVYLIIYFKAEDRSKRVEQALPDALQLISANLRAGMTPFRALRHSARKEFGPLKEEIDYASGKAFGTQSFSRALLRISERVNSEMMERAMKLFTTAMKSGGHLAQLLEELGKDISDTRALKNELETNTKTYTMFIMFIIVIGTPLLLAIAIHFIEVISNIQGVSTNAQFGLGFLAGEVIISTSFMTKMSVVLLTMTSLLASMLVGVIREGKARQGFKLAPLMIIGTFIMFLISRNLIAGFLG